MEEDLEILERALSNLEATESQEKSDYEGLYKNWGKSGSQEKRRAELLEIQKANRKNKIDKFRGILELVSAVEDNMKLFNLHKNAPYRPNIYVAGFHKTCLTYSNVLMLSEWMIERPSDFEKNWFVVPCPKGVRLLVIANNGTTKFYSKHGHFKFERYTGLPGGNPYNFYRKQCCVLDCFYYEVTNKLYVMDLLAWNNQPMTDGETEFRRYWMQTQLEDFPDTKTINKKNKVIIELLPMMPCTTHYLSFMLSTYPYYKDNTPPLDGLLFYHKKAHYVAGETPLVGWLFPYMIPEVLGKEITIHPGYLAEMPADYINQENFIEKFEAKYALKNKRYSSANAVETNSTNGTETNTADDIETNSTDVMETNSTNVIETNSTNVMEINSTNVIDTNSANVIETNSTNGMASNSANVMETNITTDLEEKHKSAKTVNVIVNKLAEISDELNDFKPMETDNQDAEQTNGKNKKKGKKGKRSARAKRSVSMNVEEEKLDAAKPITSD